MKENLLSKIWTFMKYYKVPSVVVIIFVWNLSRTLITFFLESKDKKKRTKCLQHPSLVCFVTT